MTINQAFEANSQSGLESSTPINSLYKAQRFEVREAMRVVGKRDAMVERNLELADRSGDGPKFR
jgi:hypothetical protein